MIPGSRLIRNRGRVGSAFLPTLPEENTQFMMRCHQRRGLFGWLALSLILTAAAGCDPNVNNSTPPQEKMTLRDINAVLDDHDDALMAIDGVVGVAVGLMDDDKTQCLKVLVVSKTPELIRRIPSSIEGYPVVVEESGVIRPFQSSSPDETQ
ncbi:MAG: hypothetical protein ACU84H_08795 [Gammaproteobacteria bacterium]